LDNPYDSEDDCVADVESDIEQDNGIEDPECPEQQDVSALPNVTQLIQPTQKSNRLAEKVLVTISTTERRKNN